MIAREKSTNKSNAGLTDQLQNDIALSAKIRQIKTKLLDFFSYATVFGNSVIECIYQCVSCQLKLSDRNLNRTKNLHLLCL